jgi:hypothetical protein
MILNSVFPFSHLLPKHTAIRPPSQPLVAQVNEELFKSQPQRFRRRDEELGSVKKHQGLLFIQDISSKRLRTCERYPTMVAQVLSHQPEI